MIDENTTTTQTNKTLSDVTGNYFLPSFWNRIMYEEGERSNE
jgi:hypothetical protein